MLSIDLIPWWIKTVAIGLVIASIFSSGIYFESLRWDHAASKQALASKQDAIDLLKKNMAVISSALQVDSTQAITDAKSLEDLERITNALVSKTPDTACLGADDTDSLRQLFGKGKGK